MDSHRLVSPSVILGLRSTVQACSATFSSGRHELDEERVTHRDGSMITALI
jgi:hypothetical protein